MNENTVQLRLIMAYHGLNCPAVAKLIHRKSATIRQYRIGTRNISSELLQALKMKVELLESQVNLCVNEIDSVE